MFFYSPISLMEDIRSFCEHNLMRLFIILLYQPHGHLSILNACKFYLLIHSHSKSLTVLVVVVLLGIKHWELGSHTINFFDPLSSDNDNLFPIHCNVLCYYYIMPFCAGVIVAVLCWTWRKEYVCFQFHFSPILLNYRYGDRITIEIWGACELYGKKNSWEMDCGKSCSK